MLRTARPVDRTEVRCNRVAEKIVESVVMNSPNKSRRRKKQSPKPRRIKAKGAFARTAPTSVSFEGANASEVTRPPPTPHRINFQGVGYDTDTTAAQIAALPPKVSNAVLSDMAAEHPNVLTGTGALTAGASVVAGIGAVKSRRSAVARSLRANKIAIVLSVASLTVLIDEKLASLRDERPNDRDAQAARDEAIGHYESLKRDLEALRDVTLQLERGKAKERTVENVANTFVWGIRNWWEKGHEKICDKAFDAAIFISCVGLCSLVDSGGPIAVAVSGALVGGKAVVHALKALPRRLR
jgi:hypothetical protein